MSESILKRYVRYTKYMTQWIFLEKIRGLDFSMRDTSLLNESGGMLHGYSKTDEAHAKEIFRNLEINDEKRILDVGCGKGAFLREACKEPFADVAGIEYSEELAEIAKKNFKLLGLTNRVRIFQGDAAKFKHYGKYNVFYFFNPFNAEIMNTVMSRIVKDQKEKIWIILHNLVSAKVVENHGGKKIIKLYDTVKSYETNIYELEK